MPLTGTEQILAASMFTMVQAEVGALPNPEAIKQLKALCNGLAKAIVPHIVANAMIPAGIGTAGSPTAQLTVTPGTII
jgi:hypothetical protein